MVAIFSLTFFLQQHYYQICYFLLIEQLFTFSISSSNSLKYILEAVTAEQKLVCQNFWREELRNWREVGDFYRRASEFYIECGRSQPASDTLAKGARALEDSLPEEAIQLYTDACAILEDDGGEQMAFDLYRDASSVYIKHEKYTGAASFLLRLGLAADKCNATNSQGKAYLSAIIVYLYAQDYKQAEKCYNDCSQIGDFLRSDHSRCASKLLAAFQDGDIEEIRRITQSGTISNLDHVIIRLARKLPTGDVKALKANATKEEEQPLDENDLT